MQFYTKKHQYYCGIDLHTKIIYICLLDSDGKVLIHEQTKANPAALMKVIKPYLDNLVITVECMFKCYWVSNFCHEYNIKFVLGHALYMKAIHGGMLPEAYAYPEHMRATRDLMRRRTFFVRQCAELKTHTKIMNHQYNLPDIVGNLKHKTTHEFVLQQFDDLSAKRSVQANTDMITFYHKQIASLEAYIKKNAKADEYQSFMLLQSIHGIGDVLAMTILYEIHTIKRFPSVQKFASYSRLIKCKAEFAGKVYGTSGNKNGNAHLKWAFPEAAALYLR